MAGVMKKRLCSIASIIILRFPHLTSHIISIRDEATDAKRKAVDGANRYISDNVVSMESPTT